MNTLGKYWAETTGVTYCKNLSKLEMLLVLSEEIEPSEDEGLFSEAIEEPVWDKLCLCSCFCLYFRNGGGL